MHGRYILTLRKSDAPAEHFGSVMVVTMKRVEVAKGGGAATAAKTKNPKEPNSNKFPYIFSFYSV